MKSNKLLFSISALAAVGMFAWFAWPTEWVYTEISIGEKGGHGREAIIKLQIRENRFTGQKQAYTIVNDHQDWADWHSGI